MNTKKPDVKFTDRNGKKLDYIIKKYDKRTRKLEVDVKLPNVQDGPSIIMSYNI